MVRHCLLSVSLLSLVIALPAGSETLSGGDIQLHGGAIAPAASAPLSNASGTLHLEGSTLSVLGAGHSSGSSGIQLYVGTAPVPVPEAAALWQLGAGVLGLGLLQRRHRRRPR